MPEGAGAAAVVGQVAGGLAVVLAVVLAVLHLRMRSRLRRLNRELREVAAGDLERVLPRGGDDVIGQLTAGIASMVARLRDNYEDLRVHDELRRRLIANVSHELRTPLTSIQGYLDTLRLSGADSPDFARHLEVCIRETGKLSRLVKDLFELSKLDTRSLEFHFEAMSLTELADQVGLAFEQRMMDKHITFTTHFPDEPLEVVGDGNRLGQVITNLLGNASVFTPPGGRVTLSCARRKDKATVTVEDTGIGIAEKDLPHIFESFFHLEKSRTRNLGGTGLGLAICKAIVEAHKGRIDVQSRVGHGTTFTVELDLAPEHA